jgi:hypothetical protein
MMAMLRIPLLKILPLPVLIPTDAANLCWEGLFVQNGIVLIREKFDYLLLVYQLAAKIHRTTATRPPAVEGKVF